MNKQRIIRVGAIVAVAGITGFVVQSQGGATGGPPVAAASLAAVQLPVGTIEPDSVVTLSASEQDGGLSLGAAPDPVTGLSLGAAPDPVTGLSLGPTSDPLAGPNLDTAAEPATGLAAATDVNPAPLAETAPPAPAAEAALAATCTEDMALIPQPGAMLDLGLLAGCRPDQRVLIRHGGLVVTGQTSSSGTLIASIPALESPAEVVLVFADGTEIADTVEVADLARFDRFAVQWMDQDAFQLHALERGAKHGDAGHISAAAPRKPGADGGFLSIIGDDRAERPLMAEVFTWPADLAALAGRVDLTLEAAITENTCNREILGETLQLIQGRLLVRDLSIEMPGCEAVGEFVVLSNPVAAEKLASN